MNQQKYNCIIVDDEADAIELLSETIAELYSNICIKGAYSTWKTALEGLRGCDVDILFLDISMPQKNGMDILSLIPELGCEIIFVTAYSEHAVDAFNFGATGYILKPIDNAVFIKTVNKAIERINNKRLAAENKKDNTNSIQNKISIPNHKGLDYLNVENILYFEALKRHTKVVEQDRELYSSYNIGKFKELVEGYPFYQVHRSFIVNLNHIIRYETIGILTMSNQQTIPISRNLREDFLNVFERIKKMT